MIKSFKEELKILVEGKTNIVVLFILPLIVVLILGVELSGEVLTEIPIVVVDHDGSSFSMDLALQFDSNETFDVKYRVDSNEELEKLIRNSKARAGIIIPEGFYDDIMGLESPSIAMIYDGSNMSVTSAAKAKATEILLTYKAGITSKQLMARLGMSYEDSLETAQGFIFRSKTLYNPSKSFQDFLTPMLVAGIIQIAIALCAATSIKHEMLNMDKKKRLGYAAGKVIFFTFIGTSMYIICTSILAKVIGIPFRGSMRDVILMSFGLCFAVASFTVLISAVIRKKMVAIVGAGLFIIPNSMMAGTTWPLISMLSGYHAFANYIPFIHFVDNYRNIFLKGSMIGEMTDDLVYMLCFGAVFLVLAEIVVIFMETGKEDSDNEDISENIQKRVSVDI
jgi:ABC-2 type transport system permease protein